MSFKSMQHDVDPAKKLLDELGDLSDIEIFNNQVLVAVYIRPEKRMSGVYLPSQNLEEDKFQGKVGLIVKTGPLAFKDPDNLWFKDMNFEIGDWVFGRATDGWSIMVKDVLCRIYDDNNIRGRAPYPDYVR